MPLIFALMLAIPSPVLAATTTEDLKTLATDIAKEHGLNQAHFLNVINCESGWQPDIAGDQNRSFGIAQIFLPAHPDISKDDALDPEWALEWMAEQWANGNARAWSCYNLLYVTSQPPS